MEPMGTHNLSGQGEEEAPGLLAVIPETPISFNQGTYLKL